MTTKQTKVECRVSSDLKAHSSSIFKAMGMTTSQGINVFLKAVVNNKGIPFPLKISNPETLQVLEDSVNGENFEECTFEDHIAELESYAKTI